MLGLDHEIRIEPADTMNPGDSVRQQNPLGKIPALVLEDGTVLFDSRVILEYLDHRAGGGRIIPTAANARFAALRLQALADGIMDASILLVYEGRWRPPERHEPKWVDLQAGKVARALAALEAAPPALTATPDVGPDRARVCAGLSRLSLPRHLAHGSSALGRVARRVRPPRAGLCRDQAAGCERTRANAASRLATKKPRIGDPGLDRAPSQRDQNRTLRPPRKTLAS